MATTNLDDLRRLLATCPPAGSRFRHYKGGEYLVVGAAVDEATLQAIVLYRPTQGDASDLCWARPLSVWNSCVDHGAEQVRRFSPID